MAFTLSGSQVLVTGNETGLNLRAFYGTNPTAGKQLSPNIIEALFQIKIQNGAVLNTSDVTLLINHRVEGQANVTTDTGIWSCNGGGVVVQGGNTMFAEEWAIQQWENVHVYIQKTGGNQSFIGSNARPIPSSFKDVKFILKNGSIDAHLQATGGTGTLNNVLFKNEGSSVGIIGLRDSDTNNVELYRIEPFGWNNAKTSLHKNMKLFNTANNEINYNFRRNNGGAVFYNVINSFNDSKMNTVRYVATGAGGGDGARSVVVGAYAPRLLSETNTPISGVEMAIFKVSDNSLEANGTTGVDGKVVITQGSAIPKTQSYNNTFVVNGATYSKIITESGVKYIKQSIIPTTTGGNVASVDQGDFKIVQRKLDKDEIVTTQSFTRDYLGDKIMFSDKFFTNDETLNLSMITIVLSGNDITGITINVPMTLDKLYDIIKAYLFSNLLVNNVLFPNGFVIDLGSVNVNNLDKLTNGIKLKYIQANCTANASFTNINVIGNVIQNTPTNLTNVDITGTLSYNSAVNSGVILTNTTIGTVMNTDIGLITIEGGTITNYTDPEINYLNSTATIEIPTGFETFAVYASLNDALNETNALFTGTHINNVIQYKAELYGGLTMFIRPSDADITNEVVIMPQLVPIGIGNYTFIVTSFSESSQLNTLISQVQTLGNNLKKVNNNVINASLLIPANETF